METSPLEYLYFFTPSKLAGSLRVTAILRLFPHNDAGYQQQGQDDGDGEEEGAEGDLHIVNIPSLFFEEFFNLFDRDFKMVCDQFNL